MSCSPARVRRLLRRRKNVRVVAGTAHGTVSASGTVTGRGYVIVPEHPTVEDLAELLRRRIAQVQEEINEVRSDVAGARADRGIASSRFSRRPGTPMPGWTRNRSVR